MSERFSTPEHEPLSNLTYRAQELYDKGCEYTAFISEFTRKELVELWSLCGDGVTYSFDDEVYDALHVGYNYWESADE